MKGFIRRVTGIGLISTSAALLACAGTPSRDQGTMGSDATDVSESTMAAETSGEAQSVAENAGLGVVNEGGEKTVRCKKRRRTGSNLAQSNCSSRDDIDRQPVREGLNLPGLDVMTGTGQTRPGH